MPEAMERALKVIAKKKGFGKERTGAYVYGTMRKVGWVPSTQKKKKKKGHSKKEFGEALLKQYKKKGR